MITPTSCSTPRAAGEAELRLASKARAMLKLFIVVVRSGGARVVASQVTIGIL